MFTTAQWLQSSSYWNITTTLGTGYWIKHPLLYLSSLICFTCIGITYHNPPLKGNLFFLWNYSCKQNYTVGTGKILSTETIIYHIWFIKVNHDIKTNLPLIVCKSSELLASQFVNYFIFCISYLSLGKKQVRITVSHWFFFSPLKLNQPQHCTVKSYRWS